MISTANDSHFDTRREFLRTGAIAGATAAAGFSIPKFGYGANYDRVRVGVIGCGGRGRGAITNVLTLDSNVEVVALGDMRQESIDIALKEIPKFRTRDKKPLNGFKVTPDHCFVGLDAYKQVCNADVDVVFIATPPGWRPEHFEYAVAAGKHIFCEKPVATDPVTYRRFKKAAQQSVQKRLWVLGGTQRRHHPGYLEAMQRIRDGQIGDVITAHIYFNTGDIWFRDRAPGMTERDYWLHNWFHVDFLCGDHIVEQHFHNFDVANWVMDAYPAKAYGMGGRQYHVDRPGNIYDHFAVEYEYPDGRRMTSMCRQIAGTDSKITEDIIGTKGTAILSEKAPCEITGAKPWRHQAGDDMWQHYELEHRNFLAALRAGQYMNDADRLADCTLTAMLGRESAYTGKVLTWNDVAESKLSLWPQAMESWDGSLRPVPKPGTPRI